MMCTINLITEKECVLCVMQNLVNEIYIEKDGKQNKYFLEMSLVKVKNMLFIYNY